MTRIAYNHQEEYLGYAEYGNLGGFPILIQHGMIASIKDASIFSRLINAGAHLVCMARPGYGESSPYEMKNIAEWADIASMLITELKLSHFDILGMSSGAPYSYSIGAKFPDQVRNIYIFSGTPALCDPEVQSYWPYPLDPRSTIPELQKLARELFFSNLSADDMTRDEIRDSTMNNCYGIALDLKLRCMDWGFSLADVKARVTMRHSKFDPSVPFITAELTSQRLPSCRFETMESDVHFSDEALDDFIKDRIAPWFCKPLKGTRLKSARK